MSFSRPRVRRWMFDVGRSAFVLFNRHEFHPALRTISRVIGYYFGMHKARVLLHVLMLLLLLMIGIRAIAISRPYLSRNAHQQRDYALEYG